MTPVLITCLRFLCTWYRAKQDEENSGTRLSENPWIKQWLFIKVVYHSHGQTGRFMVCVNGSQSSGQLNFVPEIAFNIWTRQSHLSENGREGLKLVSKIALKKWNTNFLLEHSIRKNRTIFSDVPLLPEIFRWEDPKRRVPFTFQPDFLENCCKW